MKIEILGCTNSLIISVKFDAVEARSGIGSSTLAPAPRFNPRPDHSLIPRPDTTYRPT